MYVYEEDVCERLLQKDLQMKLHLINASRIYIQNLYIIMQSERLLCHQNRITTPEQFIWDDQKRDACNGETSWENDDKIQF